MGWSGGVIRKVTFHSDSACSREIGGDKMNHELEEAQYALNRALSEAGPDAKDRIEKIRDDLWDLRQDLNPGLIG